MSERPLPRGRLAKEIAWVNEPDGTTSMVVTYEDGTREKFTGVKTIGVSLAGCGPQPTKLAITG